MERIDIEEFNRNVEKHDREMQKLTELMNKNNIVTPRFRCCGLMSNAERISIDDDKENISISSVIDLCESEPFWTPNTGTHVWDWKTDSLKKYYLIGSKEQFSYSGIRWDRIHGWKRKVLKTYIHNEITRRQKEIDTWNKYVGRRDVLYIRARIGGGNWPYYYREVVDQPWFLEKVDDSFDSTYCSIYAKISD
jgi:hypothetical protein